jgi:hypothetical protein
VDESLKRRAALIIRSAKTLCETRALRTPRLSNQRVILCHQLLRRAEWLELRSRPDVTVQPPWALG